MKYYCPLCFAEIPPDVERCPACGGSLVEWQLHPYTERLMQALGHPHSEVRMGVIIALGGRADPATAAVLTQCAFAYPNDVVQALEIVHSLSRFAVSPERTAALKRLVEHHPAHATRVAATEVLNGSS